MKKRKSFWLKAAILFYLAGLAYSVYYNLNGHTELWLVPVSCLVPFIVPVVFKLLHIKLTERIMILNLLFCFFAAIVGSTLGGYNQPYYDKIVHFGSGLLLTMAGYILFCVLKKIRRVENKEDAYIMLIFINAFNLAIAVLWEFYEYSMLVFFNYDCINHYSTGIHDSMTDMLCACVGGLLITLGIYHSYHRHKPNFLTKIYEELFDANEKV